MRKFSLSRKSPFVLIFLTHGRVRFAETTCGETKLVRNILFRFGPFPTRRLPSSVKKVEYLHRQFVGFAGLILVTADEAQVNGVAYSCRGVRMTLLEIFDETFFA